MAKKATRPWRERLNFNQHAFMGGKITRCAGEQAMTRAESWQPPAILGKTWKERSQKLPEYIRS